MSLPIGSSTMISQSPLIVSMTTLPSRMPHLRSTLDSLKQQTRQPERVYLCLPRWSRREQCAYVTPAWLSEYAGWVQVVDCADDFGPGSKLLGCLDHLPANACLVVVDDDMRYKKFFLEMLHEAQCADQTASFSFYTFPCGPFVVGQGADGFSFNSANLVGIRDFAARALQHPSLRLVDDLWISAYLQRCGVAVKSLQHKIPGGGTVYEAVHEVNQLRDMGGSHSREVLMAEGTRHLLESGLLGHGARIKAISRRALARARDALPRR